MLVAIDPQRVPEGFVQSTVTLRADIRMDAVSVQVLSRTNLERLIEKLDLYRTERTMQPMEDVVNRMRDDIKIELVVTRPGMQAYEIPNAFHVRFTYPDPDVAAQVAQQLGSLFVDQNAKDRSALAKATNTFLESQLAEARERLEVQERRLEGFRERYGKELPTQMQVNLQAGLSIQLQIQTLNESMARDRDREAPSRTAPPRSCRGAGSGTARQRSTIQRPGCAGTDLRFCSATVGGRSRAYREPRTAIQAPTPGRDSHEAFDQRARGEGESGRSRRCGARGRCDQRRDRAGGSGRSATS